MGNRGTRGGYIHEISADGLLTTLSIQLNMDKAAVSTVQLKLVLTELSQAYSRHIAVGLSFAALKSKSKGQSC